jgi:very-short-patch-repair endonuclease
MRIEQLSLADQAQLKAGNVQVGKAKKKHDDSAERLYAWQCAAFKLPTVQAQFRFIQSAFPTNKRKVWKTDFAFTEFGVMVEIDGGIWRPGGGAHSHPVDITRNMTKQNDAALMGFVTLRFTPAEVKSKHAIAFTQRVLFALGWKGAI